MTEDFVSELRTAIREDAETIREMDLDRSGGFHRVTIRKSLVHAMDESERFVDRLGRVVLPAGYDTAGITSIALDDGIYREVIRLEPRYEGDRQVAWVCYLGDTDVAETETAN